MSRRPAVAEAIELYAFLRDRALGRVALTTALLGALGALAGALCTATAFLACVAVGTLVGGPLRVQSIGDVVVMTVITIPVGAVLGAGSAIVAGWLLMRRVPLWRSILEPGALLILAAAACGPLGLGYAIPAAVGTFWLSSARLGWSHRRAARGVGRERA